MSIDIEPFLLVVLGQIYKKPGMAAIVWLPNKSYLIVLKKANIFSRLRYFHQLTHGPKEGINPN